jgi:hypothetical protein
MTAAQQRPALASYRDAVTELSRAGQPFGDIEEAIDEVDDITRDQKAALWLLAFSLRPAADQQRDAHRHLELVR